MASDFPGEKKSKELYFWRTTQQLMTQPVALEIAMAGANTSIRADMGTKP